MSSNNFSENVMEQANWLKYSTSDYEYSLLRSGKDILNIEKNKVYKTKHNSLHDFNVLPKNSYSSKPFNGSTFFIDFEVPKMSMTISQIVLKFRLENDSPFNAFTLNPALMIERVSLLKNSNVEGLDVSGYAILFHNLYKISEKYKFNEYNLIYF